MFRDLFIAIISLNSAFKTVEWKDTFLIVYAMCILDALIVGAILLKAVLLLSLCACQRKMSVFIKYSWGAEIFLGMLSSFSLTLYFVCYYYGARLDLMSRSGSSEEFSANLAHLDRSLNAAIFHVVLVGILLVHFSPEHSASITWGNNSNLRHSSITSRNTNDYRKAVLERKGFVQNVKSSYVLRPVSSF